jgi:hypothetical protein
MTTLIKTLEKELLKAQLNSFKSLKKYNDSEPEANEYGDIEFGDLDLWNIYQRELRLRDILQSTIEDLKNNI